MRQTLLPSSPRDPSSSCAPRGSDCDIADISLHELLLLLQLLPSDDSLALLMIGDHLFLSLGVIDLLATDAWLPTRALLPAADVALSSRALLMADSAALPLLAVLLDEGGGDALAHAGPALSADLLVLLVVHLLLLPALR